MRTDRGEGLDAALARLENHGYEVGESENYYYVKVHEKMPSAELFREVSLITAGTGIGFRLNGCVEHGDWTAIRIEACLKC